MKVKIFQNPIDPTSFGFVFKGKDYHGLDDILLFEPDRPSPQVFISEGFRRLEELPIVPLRQTIIDGKDYANGFSGSFFVDKQFVGDVILNITAEDFRGFSSNQDVVLHVLPIENSYNSSITKIDGSSKAFNYRVLNSSTDNNFVVAAPRKFVDLKTYLLQFLLPRGSHCQIYSISLEMIDYGQSRAAQYWLAKIVKKRFFYHGQIRLSLS